MKKLILVVFLLNTIVLSLCSCNLLTAENQKDIALPPEEITSKKEDSYTEEVLEESSESDERLHVEFASLSFDDIEAYNDFISQLPGKNEFVLYEKIQHLGEFLSLTFTQNDCFDDLAQINYSSYCYSLKDENDYSFTLYISLLDEEESAQTGDVTEDYHTAQHFSNMQYFGGKNGSVFIDDIEYYYKKGKLLSISWRDGNRRFALMSCSINFTDYPTDGNSTLLDSLINFPYEANFALKTFLEDVK